MKQLTDPFERTLDDNGRIVIPSSLRKHYSGELIIMKGQNQRIWLMTRNTHRQLLQTIHDSPQDSKRALLYSFLGTSLPTEMDKSGSIKLTRILISHAHLSKKCYISNINGQEGECERLEIRNA